MGKKTSKASTHAAARKPYVMPVVNRSAQSSPAILQPMPPSRIDAQHFVYPTYNDPLSMQRGMAQDPSSVVPAAVHSHMLSYAHPNPHGLPMTYSDLHTRAAYSMDGANVDGGHVQDGQQHTGAGHSIPTYFSPVWANSVVNAQHPQHAAHSATSPSMFSFAPQFASVAEQPVRRVSDPNHHAISHPTSYPSLYPSLCQMEGNGARLESPAAGEEYEGSTPGAVYASVPTPQAGQYRPA